MDDHRTFDQRHRITIPTQAFAQAGFRAGEQVHVRFCGPGRVLIERDDLDDGLGAGYGDNYVSWISGQSG